ncbi:hypothetical protein [Neisseria mucosa]|uniref:hypothetical protein n=1 Tax=Neisseria mucosa TaxID=488 RepID=UPI0018782436|nr:hypothetical protein [Neisseria mucosa]
MIKRKKITATILTSVILFLIYFFNNYRIFFSPFEILSNKTIEQNLQGICVDEGRKLSKEELLRRALVSYFTHESSGQYFDDPSDYAWKDRCPTEGRISFFQKMSATNRTNCPSDFMPQTGSVLFTPMTAAVSRKSQSC